MNNAEIARVMNEWMRRFIQEPTRFDREFETVNQFLADQNGGNEPSYGETCAAYMQQLHNEMAAH